MKVMVLGATGMVGSAMVRVLREAGHEVQEAPRHSIGGFQSDAEVVINCVGSVPERGASPANMIHVNAKYPHEIADVCTQGGARLIHISTDCVFSGMEGRYTEDHLPDARDLYGRSKALGEVGAPHVTLRTSVVGHGGKYGLVNWLMRQEPGSAVDGWMYARFSGLTNIALAKVIRDHVLPKPDLAGLYHVAGPAIRKYDLLRIISNAYGLRLKVREAELPQPSVNRTLNGNRFKACTGFQCQSWEDMVEEMRDAYLAR